MEGIMHCKKTAGVRFSGQKQRYGKKRKELGREIPVEVAGVGQEDQCL